MVIRALSDLHGHFPTIEPCDLLLIAGDVCPLDNHDEVYQWEWLDGTFRKWLEGLPADKIVGIAGNHDFALRDRKLAESLPWDYLLDSGTEYKGLKIYGYPWVPNLPSWAFHGDDARLKESVEAIPEDIDILVTHGPPNGIHDDVGYDKVGDIHLTSALMYRLAPKLHVFGHIHEGRGRVDIGGTKFANVTINDVLYNPRFTPMEFKIDPTSLQGDKQVSSVQPHEL